MTPALVGSSETSAAFVARPQYTRAASLSVSHLCVRLVVGVWAALAFNLLSRSQAADNDAPALVAEITRLNTEAEKAKKAGDYEAVEKCRYERWETTRLLATTFPKSTSVWATAYRAIEEVDGEEEGLRPNAPCKPGLVNRLQYREAAERLAAAWKTVAATKDRILPGEIATRYFEVVQQAIHLYPDATNPESPHFVAAEADLKRALEEARDRDPCCILATPMLQIITPLDQEELFLRAEGRPDFRRRQEELVAISHSSKPSDPIMPWHGPVEFAKAENINQILAELRQADVLQRSSLRFSKLLLPEAGIDYIRPGHIFKGTDSLGQPFVYLYGRDFIGVVEDKNGNQQTAITWLDGPGKWEQRFLSLLWRTPSNDELSLEPRLREKQLMVESLPRRHSWRIGDAEFSIHTLPVNETERLINLEIQQACVKPVSLFTKLKSKLNANDQDAVLDLLIPLKDQKHIHTTVTLDRAVRGIRVKNDVSKHPLVELTRQRREQDWRPIVRPTTTGEKQSDAPAQDENPYLSPFNPIVLITKPDVRPRGPNLYFEDGEAPYLKLQTREKLYFRLEGDGPSPCCYLKRAGTTAYMPLHQDGVPIQLMTACSLGNVMAGMLKNAGYRDKPIGGNRSEVENELRATVRDPEYIPPKLLNTFTARVKAKMQDPRNALGVQGARQQVFHEMLVEGGWDGRPTAGHQSTLAAESDQLFFIYGYTHLRDTRGNWIFNRGLNYLINENPLASGDGVAGNQLDEYPYDFRSPDITKPIDTSLIYNWPAYIKLDLNVVGEHIPQALWFHPCFAAGRFLKTRLLEQPLHPEDYLRESKDYRYKKTVWVGFPLEFTGAVPAWRVDNKADQMNALNSLHYAFADEILEAEAAYQANDEDIRQLASELADARAAMASIRTREERAKASRETKTKEQQLTTALSARLRAYEPLHALQLESARYYAGRKMFHRAIVYYADLLSQLRGAGIADPFLSIALDDNGVPTTRTIRQFIEEILPAFDAQEAVLNAQLELAGTLRAAGRSSEADFLFRTIVDRHDFLTVPSIQAARDLFTSYGLVVPHDVEQQLSVAIQDIEEIVSLGRRAIRENPGDGERWRELPPLASKEEKAIRDEIATLRTLLDKQVLDGGLAAAEDRKLDQAVRHTMQPRKIDFPSWLERRQVLLARPIHARVSYAAIHPERACPLNYRDESGFFPPGDAVLPVLEKTKAEDVVAWCKLEGDAALTSDVAVNGSFLLGWYWLDQGNAVRARAAFMNLARTLRARASRQAPGTAKLVDELSAFYAVAYASSISEMLPGLGDVTMPIGNALSLPLYFWELAWFESGNPGPRGTGIRQGAELLASEVDQTLDDKSTTWRHDRYYFPDYTCTFGFVPDYLFYQALTSPLLHKKVAAEDVKKGNVDEIVEDQLPAIDQGQAKAFIDGMTLNHKAREDIVFPKKP